jgi:hypothetical protein
VRKPIIWLLITFLLLFTPYISYAQPSSPLLLVSHSTKPEQITPGEEFTLTLKIKNEGSVAANNVTVSLELGDSFLASTEQKKSAKSIGAGIPISPIDASSLRYLGGIGPGGEKKVTFKMVASGDALSRAYNLPVVLHYQGENNQPGSSKQTIGLVIVRKPDIRVIGLSYPKTVIAGRKFKVLVDIVNAGGFSVNGVSVSLESQMLKISDGNLFIGTLEPGDSDSIEAKALADTAGKKPMTVKVSYKDDFNRTQTLKQKVEIKVGKLQKQMRKQTESVGFFARLLSFFKTLFGLGEKE